MNERISREELVKIYNVEITFFDSLAESGLVRTQKENNVEYLVYDELPAFERYTNLYYDLDVNIPGLEVISNLMTKLEAVQQERNDLLRKLTMLIGENDR